MLTPSNGFCVGLGGRLVNGGGEDYFAGYDLIVLGLDLIGAGLWE
jgi:hypothetical protein